MTTGERLDVLSYAVRPRVVLFYLGRLGIVLAGLAMVPSGVAVYYRELRVAGLYMLVCAFWAAIAWRFGRGAPPTQLQSNEALVITALAFSISPLLAAIPLSASGIGFLDALLEAISGVTTTGLSTVANIESMPRTFIFSRAWMQWYGGLGFAVLSVALLAGHETAARRLVEPIAGAEKPLTTSTLFARRVLLIYATLTLLGVGALALLGLPIFDATVHTFAAISTGGFAAYNNSLAGMPDWSERAATLAISFLGAVSLPLYYYLYKRAWKRWFADAELRTLFFLCIAVTLLLMWSSSGNADLAPSDRWLHLGLLAMSAQTTTGFATFDLVRLDAVSKVILVVSMAIGGSVGSTAGGVKLLRVILFARLFQLLARKLSMPSHAVAELQLGGRRVESDEAARALMLIVIFVIGAIVSWLPFLAAGYHPIDALFEVVSALGTVGLSTGITSTDLPATLKLVLCFDMLLGRVEFIAMLLLFFPGTWIGKRTSQI